MQAELSNAIRHWEQIAPLFERPRNADELDRFICSLDELLEIVGEDEHHPLIGLVEVLTDLVEHYEEHLIDQPEGTGVDALRALMTEHDLRQSDLADLIGSQGVVSEILAGKRQLNVRQIQAPAKRFGVGPVTFIDA